MQLFILTTILAQYGSSGNTGSFQSFPAVGTSSGVASNQFTGNTGQFANTGNNFGFSAGGNFGFNPGNSGTNFGMGGGANFNSGSTSGGSTSGGSAYA